MSWKNGPWRRVARLTHLSDKAQRRLWRGLILGWGVALLALWAALSAFTRAAEKAGEESVQMYLNAAPLAAEAMDLRARKGQLESLPPLEAALRAAGDAGIGPERLRLAPRDAAGQGLSLRAQALTLRELVDLLRGLRVEAGLSSQTAILLPTPGRDERMDLDLTLMRQGRP